MNILLIGSGAREHALARALARSPQRPDLFCLGSSLNPGIRDLCRDYRVDSVTAASNIARLARHWQAELAIVGPEAPLAAGVTDALQEAGIAVVGPTRRLARIETSKAFARDLLTKYGIPGNPRYRVFTGIASAAEFLRELGDDYVVKYDGLLGGKGVKVAGDHLADHAAALAYCTELAAAGKQFVIEEKLAGEEFSLMSLSDGEHLAHLPPVQDHKRAFVGDTGPNTGGMGSYSAADHSLPFLRPEDIAAAQAINQATIRALRQECGAGYHGVLYGGFMVTVGDVRLIEYNARFGDPECLNVLAILASDFVAICQAVVTGNLQQDLVRCAPQATVCKYVVPEGYPDNPVQGRKIDISGVKNPDQLYLAAVDQRTDGLYATGSRTAAVVGIADTITAAEAIAQAEAERIRGPLFHRKDIGTEALLQRRVMRMKNLRC